MLIINFLITKGRCDRITLAFYMIVMLSVGLDRDALSNHLSAYLLWTIQGRMLSWIPWLEDKGYLCVFRMKATTLKDERDRRIHLDHHHHHHG